MENMTGRGARRAAAKVSVTGRGARRAAAKEAFREAQYASPDGRRSTFSFVAFWREANDEQFKRRHAADQRRAQARRQSDADQAAA